MTALKSDASLRGKVKALAKQKGLRPQEVLQMYLFEHFLLRLSKSGYSDNFILKGGLLVAAVTGIARRTTMDLDTTVTGMDADETRMAEAVRAICSVAVDDGMRYRLERLEPIREDDEYANWRAHLRASYGRIDAPIKLDITTGDVITPREASYGYPLLFEEGSIKVMAYPLVAILAEKFETIVRRGSANTRGRDFYDVFILMKTKSDSVDPAQFKQALQATATRRGSLEFVANYRERLEEVRASAVMRTGVWERYIHATEYAKGIGFDEVIDAALELGDMAAFHESCAVVGEHR